MKAGHIQELLKARVLKGPLPEEEILTACGSDMMSDVLAFPKDKMVLLTGLTAQPNCWTCCCWYSCEESIPARKCWRWPRLRESPSCVRNTRCMTLAESSILQDFREGRDANNERCNSRKISCGKGRV